MRVTKHLQPDCDCYRGKHVERYVVVLRMIVDIDVRNKTQARQLPLMTARMRSKEK